MVFRVISPLSAKRMAQLWADTSLTKHTLPAVAGCSYSTLQHRARALGLPTRCPARRPGLGGSAFIAMWLAGVSAPEMAAHFGTSASGISRAAKRSGLPARSVGAAPKLSLAAFKELHLARVLRAQRRAEVMAQPDYAPPLPKAAKAAP